MKIDDAQGDRSTGVAPFHLWPKQVEALASLVSEKLVIFLKARQLGITWLCLGYALWLLIFQAGKVVLLFSQGQVEANEMLRRLKAMYERLPEWMKAGLPERTIDNASSQGWSNGSWAKCLPATQRAGRSFTASLAVLDEAAHQQWGAKIYAALKPTIDAGGQLFVVSSANGHDGFFDVLWEKAAAGLNRFRAIFLAWHARPERDAEWRQRQFAEATDPELVKQEYPDNPDEAFLASGRVRFPADWLDAIRVRMQSPMDRRNPTFPARLSSIDGLAVYTPPVVERRYIVGADVSEGDGGDYSAATVISEDYLDEAAHLHGHWEPGEFAEKLAVIAETYDATIVVERNNHGHAVLLRLSQLCPARIAYGHDGKKGWLTNSTTKPQVIDLLADALRDGSATVHTPATMSELRVYAVESNGATNAPSGKHDDRVMSWAVALGWLRIGSRANRPVQKGANPIRLHRGSQSHYRG